MSWVSNACATLALLLALASPASAADPPSCVEGLRGALRALVSQSKLTITEYAPYHLRAALDGKNVGEARWSYHDRRIVIHFYKVDDKYQGLGISSAMIESIVSRHPETIKITGELALTNADVILEALTRGLTREQAIAESPFAKSAAKLGFTRLTGYSEVQYPLHDGTQAYGVNYQVELSRP